MIETQTKLTLEEFLALPEGDVNFELVDDLLPGLVLTPHQIFQEAGLL